MVTGQYSGISVLGSGGKLTARRRLSIAATAAAPVGACAACADESDDVVRRRLGWLMS